MGNTPASQHAFQGLQTQPASVSTSWGGARLVTSKALETTPAKHKDSSRVHAQGPPVRSQEGAGGADPGVTHRSGLCRGKALSPACTVGVFLLRVPLGSVHTQSEELSNHGSTQRAGRATEPGGDLTARACPGRRCRWPTVTTTYRQEKEKPLQLLSLEAAALPGQGHHQGRGHGAHRAAAQAVVGHPPRVLPWE